MKSWVTRRRQQISGGAAQIGCPCNIEFRHCFNCDWHLTLHLGKMKFTSAIMSAFGPVPEDEADVDREIRIEKMKRELDEISGGLMISRSFGDVPTELEEIFLERVCAFEKATLRHEFNRLFSLASR